MKQEIKAVILDYGGVISTKQVSGIVDEMCRILCVSVEEFKNTYRKYRHDYDSHAISAEDYWRQVCHELQKSCTSDMIDQLIELDVKSWIVLNTEMIHYITALKKCRVKIAVISNMTKEVLNYMSMHFQWLHLFDHLVFSCEIKRSKPDTIIYHTCLDLLLLPAHDCVFIDDSYENILAAKELGFHTVHFRNYEQFRNEMDYKFSIPCRE